MKLPWYTSLCVATKVAASVARQVFKDTCTVNFRDGDMIKYEYTLVARACRGGLSLCPYSES